MGAGASTGDIAAQVNGASLEQLQAEAGQLSAENREKLLAALMAGGSTGADWRRELLAELFAACDDDRSGALSRDEFQQLFAKADGTSSAMFTSILFGQADASGDGKLTVDEFVALYLDQLASHSDDSFRSVCEKMIKVAKEVVVMDKEAAVAESSGEPPHGATAPPRGGGGKNLPLSFFVSYASWPKDAARFISHDPAITHKAKSGGAASLATGGDGAGSGAAEWRRELLTALFKACDDNNSGALTRPEFQQLFAKADNTSSVMFASILFGKADTSGDGKLSSDEFVALYLDQLHATEDGAFRAACERMIEAAKKVTVADDEEEED
jgi:Ca2+-binding EF-hand superfamily protein